MTTPQEILALARHLSPLSLSYSTYAVPDTSQTSPLLDLPGEIRNLIIDLALPPRAHYHFESPGITTTGPRDAKTQSRGTPMPPILHSCRQLRAEGASLYGASRKFVFCLHYPSGSRNFAAAVTAQRATVLDHLRKVRFHHVVWTMWTRLSRTVPGEIRQKSDYVSVTVELTVGERLGVWDPKPHAQPPGVYHGGERGLCACTFRAMAAAAASKRPGAVIDLLLAFVEMIAAHAAAAELGPDRAGEVGAKSCIVCRKVKAI